MTELWGLGHHLWGMLERILSKLWEMVRDREGWQAAAPGVTKSWTRLGN